MARTRPKAIPGVRDKLFRDVRLRLGDFEYLDEIAARNAWTMEETLAVVVEQYRRAQMRARLGIDQD